MPGHISKVCTDLAQGRVPAALEWCGQAVGFATNTVVGLWNNRYVNFENTEVVPWVSRTSINNYCPNKGDTEIDLYRQEDDFYDFSIVETALPIILNLGAGYLFAKYICSVINTEANMSRFQSFMEKYTRLSPDVKDNLVRDYQEYLKRHA